MDKEKIYNRILRGVLWGDSREIALESLKVCGLVGDEAEDIYRRAVQERVATIRRDCMAPMIKGLLLIGVGAGMLCLFWFGFGGMTRGVFVVFFGLSLIGVWKTLDGALGMLLAFRKQGSVADDP